MIAHRIEGSPFQPGDRVRVVDAIDRHVHDVAEHIGRRGLVVYLEYSCGCGQRVPDDPMIGVQFTKKQTEEFWAEELALVKAGAS